MNYELGIKNEKLYQCSFYCDLNSRFQKLKTSNYHVYYIHKNY